MSFLFWLIQRFELTSKSLNDLFESYTRRYQALKKIFHS